MENTILGRCSTAYFEALEQQGPMDDEITNCVAAVLDHLAAEILVLYGRDPRLTVHEIARILRAEASTVWPVPIMEPDGHQSLTAAERNPSLCRP